MIVVIIAGGSGTRLWPLSTPDYPKHLLALTGSKALIQYAYERARKLTDKVYVITESSHAHHVRELLPDLEDGRCIVEPARRGTASCIVLALERIGREGCDPDEPIAFVAADHYIRDNDGFRRSFKQAGDTASRTGRIILIGVEPDYPATGFGYIEKGEQFDEELFIFNVRAFQEKPDYKTAKAYLDSGRYLWNCGYFIGRLDTFVSEMEQNAPSLFQGYQALRQAKNRAGFEKAYLGLENISIDYALIEKLDDLLVVPATFDWMDLGSYGDLHKAVGSDEQGNHIQGKKVEIAGVENSIIRNHEDKPVAVIGLDNVAVINTAQGLLVTRKDLAQQVGEVSKKFSK